MSKNADTTKYFKVIGEDIILQYDPVGGWIRWDYNEGLVKEHRLWAANDPRLQPLTRSEAIDFMK